LSINSQRISNLRFADDVTLVSNSSTELKEMCLYLNLEIKKAGLSINIEKFKIMTFKPLVSAISMDGKTLEEVTKTVYLGQLIALSNNMDEENERQINIGWKKFWSLKSIFKSNFKPTQKAVNMCMLPAVTYGSATWSLAENQRNKLTVTKNAMLRSMLGVRRAEIRRTDYLKNECLTYAKSQHTSGIKNRGGLVTSPDCQHTDLYT